MSELIESLDLVDYRRSVARLYNDVLVAGVDQQSWDRWVAARTELLASHRSSPLAAGASLDREAPLYFEYDPSWHVIGTIETMDPSDEVVRVQGGSSFFNQVAWVSFERQGQRHRLALFWLDAYGGGFLLPFRDPTNGTSTYGAGRYVLDGAKSADLGSPGPNKLVLDFNFAYHPSCAWDPQWPCPLAPPESRLSVPVEAGERFPPILPGTAD